MHLHRAALLLALTVVATVALFVAFGPRSYAAGHRPVPASGDEERVRGQAAMLRTVAALNVAEAAIVDPHGGLYRCRSGARTVYRGRPCAPDAVTIPLDGGTFTVVDPHPVSPAHRPTTTLRPRMGGISRSDERVVSEKCGKLLHRREHIESQQRAGASARKMTSLTRQWHSVTRRLNELQCSNFQ